MSDIEIQQVVFQGDGLVIAYQDMDDIRVKGAVVMQRQVRLDLAHPDYLEDWESANRKLLKMLRNALADFAESDVFDVQAEAEEPDDDEKGMGED